MTEEIPEYLGRESVKERKMMARFWCENEERENRYWIEGEERRCRMYSEARETIEHMWNGEGEKGTEKNTEWRRKGYKINERDMEEEGNYWKRKRWGIGKKS
jgi:hypothetical protein